MIVTKVVWVDYIRAIASFMVVFLHTAAPLLDKYNDLSISYWFVGNIYDSIVRVCVPLFFMISGFLLLQKDELLSVYLSKRFSKLFIPIAFWSIFFVLWKSFIERETAPTLWDFYSLLLTPSYFHLWFLYALIGLYLFVPILRKITGNADNTIVVYYCIIWFLAVGVIPLGEKISGLESGIDLGSISGYIGYFLLGLTFGKKEISTKLFAVSVFIYLISVTFTACITYILTLKNEGIFVDYFYNYLAPNTIFSAVAFFIIIKYLAINSKLFQVSMVQKAVIKISSCSFGIYLIHTVFLYLLKIGFFGFKLSALSGNPLLYIPLTSVVIFLLSFLLISVIKKIPILRLVSP